MLNRIVIDVDREINMDSEKMSWKLAEELSSYIKRN